MQTVLMAAGRGTRMRPLTERRPKPLLPVADRSILEHIADAAIDGGATRLVVVVGPGSEAVQTALGEMHRDVPVSYVEQTEPRGTADAVRVATDVLDPGPFAVLNGDVLLEDDALIPLYGDTPGVLAMRVADPRNYGVFETSEDGEHVSGVVEKPNEPPSDLANAGGYLFPGRAQGYVDAVTESERGEYELTDVLEQVCEEEPVRCVVLDRWLDIGRPWELLAANEWKLAGVEDRRDGSVHARAELSAPVAIAADATVREGTTIEGPVWIATGATVGPNAYIRGPTRIGADVTVGHAAVVTSSVISAGTTVGEQSAVADSVIGRHVHLGSGTAVENRRPDREPVRMTVKGESVSTERQSFGVVIGDEASTGVNTSLFPGVVLGTGRRTEPGEGLTADRR